MVFKYQVIKTFRFILALAVLSLSSLATAVEPFTVKDIRVEGLQRTEAGTVFSYLPVKVGEVMDDEKATQAIKSLYSTGFFKDVRIEYDQDVLVVYLQERPAIADITMSGNKSFPTDKMKEGLKQIGLAEGQIFDKSLLERAEQEIKRQYLAQGKYSANVKATSKPLERNRVMVKFEIEEGSVSKIRGINIVGNQTFTDDELKDQFKLTTPDWLTWWNKNDQYSRQKLTADLEALRSFYMNQGFLEFNIDSTQVSISPDKRDIYITTNISEGDKYNVGQIKLSGELIIPEEELRSLIQLKSGETFNRQLLTESTKAMSERLSNEGYAFANVNAVPEVDKDKHIVGFNFMVDPGRRVYVRRVVLTGNARTRDEVLRREMRQMESSWYGGDKIKRSKQRLERLQYFSDVNIETPAVPGTTDQVDVNVNVTERSTGSVMLGAGLSSAEGIILGFTVNQANFLGTGNRVSAQVNTGRVNTVYSLSYTDPFFTPDGISRTFNVYRRDVDTSFLRTGTYQTSSYGGGVNFGMPLNERDSIFAGLSFDYTDVTLSSDSPPNWKRYCNNNISGGCNNYSWMLNTGWSHDTRDNIMFPNKGVFQRANLEVGLPGLDLQYYRMDYKHAWYEPITKSFTLMLNGEIGYGNSYGGKDYPFFKNYFVGGVNSVRGYFQSSIGNRLSDNSGNFNFYEGGTKRIVGNAEVFFPVPGLKDSNQFRLSTFVDTGSVWGDKESINLSELRYSAGFGVSWFSPFGPLKVFVAKAFKDQETDRTQVFGFQMGSQF
ncbi:MAG: outer membrane protein assembly factor BamA [Methylophilaceae bacterium]|jgi:outer membrane protein insertion porin family|nr:outer membrane protein assembly factor BamA [Methylophilaceae bacterium]